MARRVCICSCSGFFCRYFDFFCFTHDVRVILAFLISAFAVVFFILIILFMMYEILLNAFNALAVSCLRLFLFLDKAIVESMH